MNEPREELHMKDHGRWRLQWMVGGVVAVLVGAGTAAWWMQRSGDPLPASVRSQAGFALYYPAPLPRGFRYEAGSAGLDGSLVMYTLSNGDQTVKVSEQAAPATPPDLTKLPGFTSLKTLAGTAAVGTTATHQPMAIIISNTTLVTVTGAAGVPSDVVAGIAQNMSSLPQN